MTILLVFLVSFINYNECLFYSIETVKVYNMKNQILLYFLYFNELYGLKLVENFKGFLKLNFAFGGVIDFEP